MAFGLVGGGSCRQEKRMRLTKLGHSCVRLEKDGPVLVIDPGTWSDASTALTGASAVLITHEHAGHRGWPSATARATGW
jgi:L-ascorbate metabolism protein UlaG (beta-lactamase superfamily)